MLEGNRIYCRKGFLNAISGGVLRNRSRITKTKVEHTSTAGLQVSITDEIKKGYG